ncbi:hypothetical protein BKA62DRAFT_681401 [Auriculariales sp. MPI-PUGE-AT-0066]|nr:hypothetical protein BKA62DRAFT_681401 [Auriculariales sp. MPI-PUGE-AT-0066]
MIVKGTRKASFRTMFKTSLVFKILVLSLPLTLGVFITEAFQLTISIAVVPFVLLWKLILLLVFVRRRRSLTELDPQSARDRTDTNKRFHFLRSWWNYALLAILITAYCGMISYNAAASWFPAAIVMQTVLLGLDTVALATLVFAIARLHKLAREEQRLRQKAGEAGVTGESDRGDEESVAENDGSSSVNTPPPAYTHGRTPPTVVCMMCACSIPHGEKVLIQPALR